MLPIQSNQEYLEKDFNSLEILKGNISTIEFSDCIFNKCNFSDTVFTSCVFERCIFRNSNLSNIKLPNCKFIDSKFENCKIIGIDWKTVRTEMGLTLDCTKCDLSYSLFSGINLSESIFNECKIYESDFSDSILRKSTFKNSDFLRTKFFNTDLRDCDFTESKNYFFNPGENKCKGSKFNHPEVLSLLESFGIKVE